MDFDINDEDALRRSKMALSLLLSTKASKYVLQYIEFVTVIVTVKSKVTVTSDGTTCRQKGAMAPPKIF